MLRQSLQALGLPTVSFVSLAAFTSQFITLIACYSCSYSKPGVVELMNRTFKLLITNAYLVCRLWSCTIMHSHLNLKYFDSHTKVIYTEIELCYFQVERIWTWLLIPYFIKTSLKLILHHFRLRWGLPKILFLISRYALPPMIMFVPLSIGEYIATINVLIG